jgi:hypothetical protein
MGRRLVVWLLTVPLALAGTQVAHALVYGAAVPVDEIHRYLTYLPLAGGLALAALTVGLTGAARAGVGVPAWPFAFVGPLVFSLQEHLERLQHGDGALWLTAAEPTFVAGLLLQVPFALLAYAAAKALLAATRVIARALARPRRLRLRPHLLPRPVVAVVAPRIPAAATGYGKRGPPARAR